MPNTSKKTYYLPEKLTDYFVQWAKPGRDYSPKVAGAILYYLTLPADLREICEQLAYTGNIKQAIKKLQSLESDSTAQEFREGLKRLEGRLRTLEAGRRSKRRGAG